MNLIYASTILIGAVSAERPGSPEKASGLRRPERRRRERRTQGLFGGDGASWGLGNGDSQMGSFLDGAFDMIFGDDAGGDDAGDSQAQPQPQTSFPGGDAVQTTTSFLGADVDAGDLCTDACTDPEACASFVSAAAMFDPTSAFEDACDAGCVPEAKLSHCDAVCGGAGETEIDLEVDAAVSSAIARAGFVDVRAAKEIMCGDCEFYRCCVDPDKVQDSTTKYGACKAHLDDNLQHQAIGDSLLEEIFGSLAETLDTVVGTVAEVLDTVADVMEDIDVPSSQWEASTAVVDAVAEALDAVDASGALDAAQNEDGAWGSDPVLSQIVESFSEALDGMTEVLDGIDIPQQWDFGINDWGSGAVWSGADADSGLSVFGQVAGGFECPCANEALCDSVFMGGSDRAVLEEACDSDCLPAPGSCEEICGDGDGRPQFLASVADMACGSCRFFECCSNGQGGDPADEPATATKFDACQVHLPDAVDILSDFQWDGGEVQEWIDSVDWTDIAEDLGISETMQNLQTMFDEALAMQDSFPVTCNPDTCPITGLCEMNVNLATVDFDEYCKESAFFKCGDGLEDMCTAKCNGDGASDGGIFAPFCSLCGVATCCKTSQDDGKSFQDCASGVSSGDVAAVAVAGEGSNAGAVDAPPVENVDDVQDTPSESDGSPASAPAEEPSIESTVPVAEDALAESNGGATTAASAEEDAPSEPVEGPVAPFEFESDLAEVSRATVAESGSRAKGVSATLALASVAALFLTSV